MRFSRICPLLSALFLLAFALPAAGQESAAAPRIVTAAEPASGYVVVTAPAAPVAAGPAEDAAVFGEARKGDILPLKGKQGKWYFVATGEATYGWIRTDTAAIFFYPEFLPAYRPPATLLAPPAEPAPPAPPPVWYGRPRGWDRSPQWDTGWWGPWFGLGFDRRHDWDRDRWRGPYRHRDRDWDDDRDRDRHRDRDRDRDYRGQSWQ